ncbi:MAG: FAD-dependent oxidoreductase [Polyangiaceae bacterium]|nr:FAD-dependent oxidoreductase [Polyangiaceae bacterium]
MLQDVLIVGGGIFGVTAALELADRGARVGLLDAGPIPHPDASSTDISKLVRMDYGSDDFYVRLMEDALVSWRSWNARFERPLFHETGFLVLTSAPMAPGEASFEAKSFDLLTARGHAIERLDATSIASRFPMWKDAGYTGGYQNPVGGWAESGQVVAALAREARSRGIEIREGVRIRPIVGTGAVQGVVTEAGDTLAAGTVIVCAGAYTPVIVPEVADRLVPIAQSVFHFDPPASAKLEPPDFLPWAADIGTTGWYGFPRHTGVLKIANHGPGIVVDPAAPRVVAPEREEFFRAFLRAKLPRIAEAPVTKTRACLYCDSFDGDFFIDAHPERKGLVVAAGGSGHAFKFAPALGWLIADAAEGLRPERRARFAWRNKGAARTEDARFSG